MRHLLLLGTIVAALALGIPGAQALSDPALVVMTSEGGAPTAGLELAEAGWAGDGQAVAELHWVGKSVRENIVIALRDATLLAMAGLVFGLGSVCVAARRVAAPAHRRP